MGGFEGKVNLMDAKELLLHEKKTCSQYMETSDPNKRVVEQEREILLKEEIIKLELYRAHTPRATYVA